MQIRSGSKEIHTNKGELNKVLNQTGKSAKNMNE